MYVHEHTITYNTKLTSNIHLIVNHFLYKLCYNSSHVNLFHTSIEAELNRHSIGLLVVEL